LDDEFVGAELSDRRRERRLIELARALNEQPSASFPDALRTDAALEAAYRLLRNEAVSADGILAGHYEQTVQRASSEDFVLAVHDTTVFEFSGDSKRDGLGPLRGKGQGFQLHVSLLVAAGEVRRPLGVVSLQTVVRKPRARKRKGRPPPDERESAPWMKGVRAAESLIQGRCSVVHVMDREGDSYDIWAALVASGHRFVIRNSRRRWLADSNLCLADVLANPTKTVVERNVLLSPRRKKRAVLSKDLPLRAGRTARLAITAQSFTLRRPIRAEHPLTTISVNVVHVREVETHGDEEPVEWTLVTTEPIDSPQAVERIVDAYRARWVIEEYFKVIKSGCAYEKRQLESFETLINALAIFIPIAWRLLLLRTLARNTDGEAPATDALTHTQVEVLVATSKRRLPPDPTVRQALQAIATLCGHIKNNGQPGWSVLARGYKKLLAFEEGWIAATRRKSRKKSARPAQRCDQ
jgi:hypothetical protein